MTKPAATTRAATSELNGRYDTCTAACDACAQACDRCAAMCRAMA